MISENQPIQREVTRAGITAWVQEYIDGGMEPSAAFVQVFEEVINEGLLEDLARLHGVSLVSGFWLDWNRRNRPAAVATFTAKPVKPRAALPPLTQVSAPPPRPRVVNVEPIRDQSLLDGLYKVNGAWVRLGSMGKRLCHAAFQQYRDSSISDEHNARYFRAIEAILLDDEQTIEMVLDDAKLMQLYQRCTPPGNTLA